MVIAKIGLAPGRIGYYDEVSGINLTTAKSVVDILPGTNTSKISEDIKLGKIVLIQGSLNIVHKQNSAYRRSPELFIKKETVAPTIKEVKAEKPVTPVVEEEVKETVVVEEPKYKSKKYQKKDKEEVKDTVKEKE